MIQLINDDCLKALKQFDDNYFDLTITSPPYNVDLGNNKYKKTGYALYKDNKEHSEYIRWLSKIFELIHAKTKSGGRVALNISDGKNGAVPTSSDMIQSLAEIGWIPMAHIIWNKNTTSNRAAWGSWLSPSSPSFPTTFERILIFGKDFKKLQYKGETDLTREEFIAWATSMWRFSPERKMKAFGHPAMFPEELPKRLIKMLSWKGGIVLDPFSGAGTTCLVAKKLKRSAVGIELSKEYNDIARKRIDDELG